MAAVTTARIEEAGAQVASASHLLSDLVDDMPLDDPLRDNFVAADTAVALAKRLVKAALDHHSNRGPT